MFTYDLPCYVLSLMYCVISFICSDDLCCALYLLAVSVVLLHIPATCLRSCRCMPGSVGRYQYFASGIRYYKLFHGILV